MKETKMAAAPSAEVRAALSEFLGAFEAFKDANDQRLRSLETRKPDVLLDEKVARIDRALSEQKSAMDRLAAHSARSDLGDPLAGGRTGRSGAFDRYVRAGDAGRLLETKDLNSGTPAEGGYLVPDETEQLITRRLTAASPMRAAATVRQVSASSFKKPVSLGGATAGWAADSAARPGTDEPTLALLDFPTAELYAMPAATQGLLDDALVDVGEWLAGEIEDVFAAQESAAFIAGDGANKPKGVLGYTAKADAVAVWGELGYVATGAAGAFSANPVDDLIDLVYTPRTTYRPGASFLMNRRTVSAIRKVKDADGNYIWQPASAPGEAASLLGYPILEAEQMPDIADTATAIAFGDFRRGYLIVDRVGVRVLRDPYSAKPHVLFYTTKRVGGGVQDFDALKLLKFAAS